MLELPRPLNGLSEKPSSAFLDSNVFIYGRLEQCNSRLVILLGQLREFEAFTSELVVEEVQRFFRAEISREAGYLARRFVESFAQVVRRDEIRREAKQLRGEITDRDLENLAVVRHLRLRRLVAYDDDYRKARVKEYTTPRVFVKLFELDAYKTEY